MEIGNDEGGPSLRVADAWHQIERCVAILLTLELELEDGSGKRIAPAELWKGHTAEQHRGRARLIVKASRNVALRPQALVGRGSRRQVIQDLVGPA